MSGYKTHWESFPLNQKGRDFVVGDIHGYFDHLERKLAKVNFDPEIDRLFSVGDIIDRGPRSHEVLEWLDKPWFFAVLGNHEKIAMEYYASEGAEWKNWAIHGGQWFMDLPREQQKPYIDAFKKLPYVFEVYTLNGTVGILHAECNPKDWWEFKFNFPNHTDNALWGMSRYFKAKIGVDETIYNIDWVVYGHSGFKLPKISGNQIYIDTGKEMGDLTLLEISDPSGPIFH